MTHVKLKKRRKLHGTFQSQSHASVVKSKKIGKIKSEVVGHQKNEIKNKLILLSQSNS